MFKFLLKIAIIGYVVIYVTTFIAFISVVGLMLFNLPVHEKVTCGKVPYHYTDMEGFMSVKIIDKCDGLKEFYAFINAKYRRIYNERFNKYISANIISSECVKE